LGAWGILIIGNNKIFEDQRPTLQRWKSIFHQELKMLSFRMKKNHAETFKEWLWSQV
jgi:hypothetical protein